MRRLCRLFHALSDGSRVHQSDLDSGPLRKQQLKEHVTGNDASLHASKRSRLRAAEYARACIGMGLNQYRLDTIHPQDTSHRLFKSNLGATASPRLLISATQMDRRAGMLTESMHDFTYLVTIDWFDIELYDFYLTFAHIALLSIFGLIGHIQDSYDVWI